IAIARQRYQTQTRPHPHRNRHEPDRNPACSPQPPHHTGQHHSPPPRSNLTPPTSHHTHQHIHANSNRQRHQKTTSDNEHARSHNQSPIEPQSLYTGTTCPRPPPRVHSSLDLLLVPGIGRSTRLSQETLYPKRKPTAPTHDAPPSYVTPVTRTSVGDCALPENSNCTTPYT